MAEKLSALWTCLGAFLGTIPMAIFSYREARGYRKLSAEIREIRAALEASNRRTDAACDHVDRASAFIAELYQMTEKRRCDRAN